MNTGEHKDHDKVGTGDIHFESDVHGEESTLGGAQIPGTPGYVGESSQRHHEYSEATQPEIRSTQLIPGPLDEHEEATTGQLQPQTIKFNDKTRHNAR